MVGRIVGITTVTVIGGRMPGQLAGNLSMGPRSVVRLPSIDFEPEIRRSCRSEHARLIALTKLPKKSRSGTCLVFIMLRQVVQLTSIVKLYFAECARAEEAVRFPSARERAPEEATVPENL